MREIECRPQFRPSHGKPEIIRLGKSSRHPPTGPGEPALRPILPAVATLFSPSLANASVRCRFQTRLLLGLIRISLRRISGLPVEADPSDPPPRCLAPFSCSGRRVRVECLVLGWLGLDSSLGCTESPSSIRKSHACRGRSCFYRQAMA